MQYSNIHFTEAIHVLATMCFFLTGVPPGVINIVFGVGPRAGEALVKHPDVPLVSFTGGTVTAKRIREVAAPYCKKFSLEVRNRELGALSVL